MPNNPGRIDGDYSIGDKEEVAYIEPPSGFGSVKSANARLNQKYLIGVGVILVIVVLILWILLK